MKAAVFFISLTLLLKPTLCAKDPSIYCLDGIQTALQKFTLGSPSLAYYQNLCQNNLSVVSMWAAAKTYCTPKEIQAGSDLLSENCIKYGHLEVIPYSQVLPILTDEFVASLPRVDLNDIDPTKIWNTSVMITKHLWYLGYKTSSEFDHQYVLHKRYGWAVYGFWGGLLVIGMANRLVYHLYNSRRGKTIEDIEGLKDSPSSSANPSILMIPIKAINHWVRAHLIIPAAFGTHHQRLFWGCSIPTRMETVIVCLFWVLNFLLCAISYGVFEDNLYYTVAIQYWRYISDRTGIISYANLPLLWLFSGRNNIFLWLTGWSFSSFNIFHRHIARIATIQAIVHSIGWSAIQIDSGYIYFALSWKQRYWYMGGMATITMSLLLGLSSIHLRLHHYEIFLVIHVVLSIITLVGLFYHTFVFTTHEYDPYLWPCVAIWVFDRVARLVRLVYCNFRVGRSGGPALSAATASYNKAADFIRVEVFPNSRLLRPGAGQHYYIYQFNKLRFWENHPFTLAASYPSIQHTADHDAVSPALTETSSEVVEFAQKECPEVITNSLNESSGPSSPSPASISPSDTPAKDRAFAATPGCNKLVFFIRPFNSWTKRLRDECTRAEPLGLVKSSLRIEGPYGHRSPLHAFENVIFIVGGTGIAGAIPYLQEHLETLSVSAEQGSGAKSTRTRSITVIWATKQSSMIRDIAIRELRPFLNRDDIHFSFHATREKMTTTPPKEAQLDEKLILSRDFEISTSRPNIKALVTTIVDEVNAGGCRGGRIAVLTCGPGAMADEARAVVHQALRNGKRGLEYFEEAFGW